MKNVTRAVGNRRLAGLLSLLVLLSIAGEAGAQAQKKGGKGQGRPGGMAPGMGSGMGGPPGMGGGMPGMGGRGSRPGGAGMGAGIMGGPGGMGGGAMPGMGGMGGMGMQGLSTIRQKNLKGDELPPLPEQKLDERGLPLGFTPSEEPPPWMTTDAQAPTHRFEDLQKESPKEWKQINKRIGDVKQAGVFTNDEDRKLIEEYVEYRLAQLTRPENRLGGKTAAHELQDKFYREINPPTVSRGDKTEVRLFMANRVVALAPQFLNNYHFVSRLQTSILLARLSELIEVPGGIGQTTDLHFTKALPELLALVKQDKRETPAGVRTWAVVGLVRLAKLPELKIPERSKIVDTLTDQLSKSGDEPWWNQFRMVEGLGQIRIVALADRRPIVAQALARVLVDESREWLVRSEAAFALGQLNYESGVDLGLIGYEIGRLTQQLSVRVLEEPDDRRWRLCYVKIYGAFKPIETGGQGLLKLTQERASLATFRAPLTAVFDKVVPIIRGALKKPDSIQEAQAALTVWLSENPPKGDRIHSAEEPLHSKEPLGAANASTNPPAGG